MLSDYNKILGLNWDEGGEVNEDGLPELLKSYIRTELSLNTVDRWCENYSVTPINNYASILSHIYSSSIGSVVRSLSYLLKPECSEPEHQHFIKNIIVLHAASIATIFLENQVKKSTWKCISSEINKTFAKINSQPGLSGSICMIHDAISRMNHNAALQWTKVYHMSLKENEQAII
ncbi:MAG: hypothetical protein H6627_11595 [Calditrichae bacterium]|nr:hypothetical protein [Calditrichota bacterium]MCB9059202.1 hypothetical protein [Calditrichia bacterium]